MAEALIADTGGLLRALAKRPSGRLAWPEYAYALRRAALVIVPALVLAEVDYFLRGERNQWVIKQTLDMGVYGLIVPHLDTVVPPPISLQDYQRREPASAFI